ncbi:MAG: hypothetical protein IPK50_19895 [Fibrobacterota bacterium]|nr:MAG: hypothetical protein IPK50_19895 [Fibrobacterota bacterium]
MKRNVYLKTAMSVLLAATVASAEFKPCGFNVGVDLKQASTKKCSYMGCTTNVNDLDIPKGLDFVAMFVGYAYDGGKVAPKPMGTSEGTFLAMAKTLNATPVWYTYIIAEGAKLALNLTDCNMGGGKTLCSEGTKYIRDNKAKILDQYKAYAQYANTNYGSKPMIWALEPDFYQYASSQNGNSSPMSFADAATFIGEIASTITAAMPSAQISMDISPWAPDNWFTSLPLSKFKYMNTSGGISQPGNTVANGNPMTWAKVKSLTKLPIIADDGYGTGGTLTSPNSNWGNVSTIKSRMADGVVALMEASPGSSWTSIITTIHEQATSTSCSSDPTPTNYTLSVTATNGGSVSVNPTGTSFASGTAVKLKATPQTGFVFTGWSGGATGSKDTLTVVMNAAMNITANFSQIKKYNLQINNATGGTITATPSGTSFDSGTVVKLKATVQTGYEFTNWTSSVSGNKDTSTLIMNGDKQVSAVFTKTNGILGRAAHGSKVELVGDQLRVSLDKRGLVVFSIVSLDGKEIRSLGTIEMLGQEQIFGLGGSATGLQFLRMRGEGWESTVPMATLSR